jgi:hypothetical protein
MRPDAAGRARSCGRGPRWERGFRAAATPMRGSLRGTVLRFCARDRDVCVVGVGERLRASIPADLAIATSRRAPGCDASAGACLSPGGAGPAALERRSEAGRRRWSARRAVAVCLWCGPLGGRWSRSPGAAEPYPAHERRRPALSGAVRQDLAVGEPRIGALDGRRVSELAVVVRGADRRHLASVDLV